MVMGSDALRQVAGTEQMLSRLRRKNATWAGPAAGSPMAVDDEVWPLMPCSEVVRNALLSAHDHLDLVRLVLLDARPTPPVATYSALRGALVGGCLGLWVVGCEDEALRRARGLALAAEDYRHRCEFHRSQVQSEDASRAEHSRPWVEKWAQRQEELGVVRARFPDANASKTTRIVTWVAREMFGDTSDAYATLMGLWQSSSSAAHGLGWGAFVRPGLTLVGHDDVRGLSEFEVAVDIDDAADHYMTCVALLAMADTLLQRRCNL